jgi:hypothetical protein
MKGVRMAKVRMWVRRNFTREERARRLPDRAAPAEPLVFLAVS